MREWLEVWNYTSTDWAGLTFTVVLVALLIAWAEARAAARLREAQARPFVTLDLHADKTFLIFLTIENTGGSMARDVKFTIEPALESAALPAIPKLKMLEPEGGIASLPPGKRITTAFDFWPDRVKRTDLPDVYQATARYKGEPRRMLWLDRQHSYTDPPNTLDLGVYRDSIPDHRKDLHDIHAVLVKIKDILAKR